jgi:hypothetical protein
MEEAKKEETVTVTPSLCVKCGTDDYMVHKCYPEIVEIAGFVPDPKCMKCVDEEYEAVYETYPERVCPLCAHKWRMCPDLPGTQKDICPRCNLDRFQKRKAAAKRRADRALFKV